MHFLYSALTADSGTRYYRICGDAMAHDELAEMERSFPGTVDEPGALSPFWLDAVPTPVTHAILTQLKAGECIRHSI